MRLAERFLAPMDRAPALPADALDPRHLAAKAPPYAWEAWLAIGVLPPGSDLRWLKVHLYRGRMKPGRHAISEIEGMDGSGDVLILAGLGDEVFAHSHRIDPPQARASAEGEPFEVRYRDRFRLAGAWPRFEIGASDKEEDLAAHRVRLAARAEARSVMWWIRAAGELNYFSALGALEGSLTLDGRERALRGAGLVEHAWGRSLSFAPSRLLKGWWHWDVLAFEAGGLLAGLSVAPLGGRGLPIRGGGALPGEAFARTGGPRVRYREFDDPPEGAPPMPTRWEGEIRSDAGTLRYEARRAGPPALVIPRGGFYGFDFEGAWRPKGGAPRAVRGAGYAESAGARP